MSQQPLGTDLDCSDQRLIFRLLLAEVRRLREEIRKLKGEAEKSMWNEQVFSKTNPWLQEKKKRKGRK